MVIDDIINGESDNVEFKEILPKNSEKYVKTVVAFANGQGGKLIVGVNDETRQIEGVNSDILFQVMDKIANSISDLCEPQVVPEIEPYTINNKTVIVISVSPGANRPYYIKSKGKEHGTYIRVGATTRLAGEEKIKELEFEGKKISWDEQQCVGYKVSENAVKNLCRAINLYRERVYNQKDLTKKIPTVTKTNLENWGAIKKRKNTYIASNAFVLFTSSYFPYSKTQCAVFAGKERGEFIDKQEYTGALYEQLYG